MIKKGTIIHGWGAEIANKSAIQEVWKCNFLNPVVGRTQIFLGGIILLLLSCIPYLYGEPAASYVTNNEDS